MRLPVVLALLIAGPASANPPDLRASTEQSDMGSYTLTWDAGGEEVVLEEATREDFSDARELYRGRDTATVVSGRLDGVFHYRILRHGEVWGAAVQVAVVHHGLGRAAAFLAIGAIVFLSTAVLILEGHRRHRREFPRPTGTPA